MDREARNHIQRATQAARALLEHEYAKQFEGVFDIRLDGTIEAEPGEHLDAARGHRAGVVIALGYIDADEHLDADGSRI